jgi:hypothetical protein
MNWYNADVNRVELSDFSLLLNLLSSRLIKMIAELYYPLKLQDQELVSSKMIILLIIMQVTRTIDLMFRR